jgi:class 3 adenylate cyclase
MASNVDELLSGLDSRVKTEFASKPEVVDKGHDLDVSRLPVEARKWHKVTDAVAVVFDLRSSTRLGVSKHAASTASIYEAATGGAVRVLDDFGANFISIQGDGGFGLFWGDHREARAVTAGITIKTFSSRHLVERLEAKWPDLVDLETGFKVGVASSPLLAKRVGVPRTDHQEPVWAGKAVNYAAKCAQQAGRHELIVTGGVWDWIENNDYLTTSCSCGTPTELWESVSIDKLPEGEPDADGRLLRAAWCSIHGAEFCEAVLAGKSKRPEAVEPVRKMQSALMADVLRAKRKREREARRNLRYARTGR